MATIKTGKSCDSMMNGNTVEFQNHHQNDNNNIVSNGARRVLATAEDFTRIRESYVANIGKMNQVVASMIEQAMEDGPLTADEIIMAIEVTGMAPRPSAWYLRAVLDDWIINGVGLSCGRRRKDRGGNWWG